MKKFLVNIIAVIFLLIGCSKTPVVQSIEVTHIPNVTEYLTDDEFNKDGLVISGVFDDGHKTPIYDYTLSDVDMTTPGEKEITVSYLDFTTTFTINVSQRYDAIYLIMGQSNASGNSPWRFLETKAPEVYTKFLNQEVTNVLMAHDTYAKRDTVFKPVTFGTGDNYDGENVNFGPEIGIADVLSQKEETSYIIKAAVSGTALCTQWLTFQGERRDDLFYHHTVSFILDRLADLTNQGKHPDVKGVFWMQGESDGAYETLANAYEEIEAKFINYLREDLKDYIHDHMNFVDAFIDTRTEWWPYYSKINEAKWNNSINIKDCYCIKTNGEDETALDLSNKFNEGEHENDKAHYDSLSELILGREAAKYLVL